MLVVDRILERDLASLRQRVVGMHDHGEMVAMIGKGPQAAQVDRIPAHADIGAPFLDAAHHLPDFALLQADAHVAILVANRLTSSGRNCATADLLANTRT